MGFELADKAGYRSSTIKATVKILLAKRCNSLVASDIKAHLGAGYSEKQFE
jgi:hypothetical protein